MRIYQIAAYVESKATHVKNSLCSAIDTDTTKKTALLVARMALAIIFGAVEVALCITETLYKIINYAGTRQQKSSFVTNIKQAIFSTIHAFALLARSKDTILYGFFKKIYNIDDKFPEDPMIALELINFLSELSEDEALKMIRLLSFASEEAGRSMILFFPALRKEQVSELVDHLLNPLPNKIFIPNNNGELFTKDGKFWQQAILIESTVFFLNPPLKISQLRALGHMLTLIPETRSGAFFEAIIPGGVAWQNFVNNLTSFSIRQVHVFFNTLAYLPETYTTTLVEMFSKLPETEVHTFVNILDSFLPEDHSPAFEDHSPAFIAELIKCIS
jgi:hypothetical protein